MHPDRQTGKITTDMRRLPLPLIVLAAAVSMGCNRVPDEVIQPEDMARLMADIRVADAVVSVNAYDYRTPVSKEALKQAVFVRHGVTQAQFDSSLVWYGHNIGRYQEVTDRSIEILEQRLQNAGSAATQAAMSVAGDSVDVWDRPRAYIFNDRSPSKYLTFAIEPDRNWNDGDVYTWHARFPVPPASAIWMITAEYDDGAIESVQSNIQVTVPGRQEITFFTDSTRRATHISGWLELETSSRRPAVVDSVGLVRRRRYEPLNGRRSQRRIIPRRSDADTTNRSI